MGEDAGMGRVVGAGIGDISGGVGRVHAGLHRGHAVWSCGWVDSARHPPFEVPGCEVYVHGEQVPHVSQTVHRRQVLVLLRDGCVLPCCEDGCTHMRMAARWTLSFGAGCNVGDDGCCWDVAQRGACLEGVLHLSVQGCEVVCVHVLCWCTRVAVVNNQAGMYRKVILQLGVGVSGTGLIVTGGTSVSGMLQRADQVCDKRLSLLLCLVAGAHVARFSWGADVAQLLLVRLLTGHRC